MPRPSARTKYFFPKQNIICPGKEFCPRLGKRIKNDFLAVKKNSMAKKSFFIYFTSKYSGANWKVYKNSFYEGKVQNTHHKPHH